MRLADNADEILPFLWIGNYQAASYMPANTAMVVNCTTNLPFRDDADGTQVHWRIPIEDDGDPAQQALALQHWTPALMFAIQSNLNAGRPVLVHCMAGRQRSAATVAAFFIHNGMTPTAAVNLIQSKRREAFFPSVHFADALNAYAASQAKP